MLKTIFLLFFYYGKSHIIWASLIAQSVKNPPAMQETSVQFLGQEDPLRREGLPTPVFWPGEFHGLYSPHDRKQLDTTERLSLSQSIKNTIFSIFNCTL